MNHLLSIHIPMKVFNGVLVLFFSSLKYMVGIFFATNTFNLGFVPSVLITVAGGMAGFFIFALLGAELRILWHKFILRRPHHPPRFNKSSRRMVWIRSRFGLASIVLLTPIILQVPIGAMLAVNITKNYRKVTLYMLASFTMYSIVFCGLYYSFHVSVGDIIHHWLFSTVK